MSYYDNSKELDQIADLQATIADLQGQIEGLEQGCHIHHVDKEQAEARILKLSGEVGMMKDERVDLLAKLESSEQRVAQLEMDNRTYINERHENMKTIETLRADHARVLGLVQEATKLLTELTIIPIGCSREQELAWKKAVKDLRVASLPAQRAQGGAAGNTKQALEFAVRALRSAWPIVCSASCPSVKRTGEEWTHRQPCDSLTLTLRTLESYLPKKGEHVCGARGFGQSLDDQCSGCEQDKPDAEGETRA